ncbi:endonuclease/exonuclease/phosphatase family protein [Mesonia sp. HuA40]|uniref:endonuclease/exonuclease/phosphatase family protein n=1 Tax=Mesonia sp. HuA40 TaxID=2602761 RepID=UPI0011CB22BD|nr:endonuclease/exonuclease/phosphatase family protein [Mesonia sp. HuA40]TXK71202.1 T9SS type A sorting domain-containing protein [Mesonia sp. HuA40]
MIKHRLSFITLVLYLCSQALFAQYVQPINYGSSQSFEVLTWNTEWFPKNGYKSINYLTEFVDELDADLIAFQEIDDIGAFNQVANNLIKYNAVTYSSDFAGLAFLYNANVIQVLDVYEIYTSNQYWQAFPRAPLILKIDYLGEEIYIINNHFKCCGDGNLNQNDNNDEENRRLQASTLIDQYITGNLMGKKVILLGDFNDVLTDAPANNVFAPFLNNANLYLFNDLAIANGSSSQWSYPNWPSHLDHIAITQPLFASFQNPQANCSTLLLENYLSNGWQEYDQNLSDHRPVALSLPNSSLDIKEPKIESKIIVSPNPTQDSTKIEWSSNLLLKKIDLLDINGNLLKSYIPKHKTNTLQVNFRSFATGLYFLRFRGLKNHTIKKLIIK